MSFFRLDEITGSINGYFNANCLQNVNINPDLEKSVGIQKVLGWDVDTKTLTMVDNVVPGPTGIQGPTGAQGIQGIQGIQGPTGANGGIQKVTISLSNGVPTTILAVPFSTGRTVTGWISINGDQLLNCYETWVNYKSPLNGLKTTTTLINSANYGGDITDNISLGWTLAGSPPVYSGMNLVGTYNGSTATAVFTYTIL